MRPKHNHPSYNKRERGSVCVFVVSCWWVKHCVGVVDQTFSMWILLPEQCRGVIRQHSKFFMQEDFIICAVLHQSINTESAISTQETQCPYVYIEFLPNTYLHSCRQMRSDSFCCCCFQISIKILSIYKWNRGQHIFIDLMTMMSKVGHK